MGLWKNIVVTASAKPTENDKDMINNARTMIERNKQLLKQQNKKVLDQYDWN